MRRILFLIAATFVCFLAEYLLSNLIDPRFVPSFLILLIIFVDLYLGIRYAILTAVMAGIMKDSFELSFFGIHVVSFVTAAYLAVFFKKYLYMSGSRSAKIFLVGAVVLLLFPVEYLLQLITAPVNLGEAIVSILLPQLFITPLISNWVFNIFKRCASRLYV